MGVFYAPVVERFYTRTDQLGHHSADSGSSPERSKAFSVSNAVQKTDDNRKDDDLLIAQLEERLYKTIIAMIVSSRSLVQAQLSKKKAFQASVVRKACGIAERRVAAFFKFPSFVARAICSCDA